MSSGLDAGVRTQSTERINRARGILVATAVVAFFAITDEPMLTVPGNETIFLRAAWIALLLLCAAMTAWGPPRFVEGAAIAAGGGSTLAMVQIALLTGGVSSPNYSWLMAFPFLAAAIAPLSVGAAAVTGLAVVVGGAAIAVSGHGYSLASGLWTTSLIIAAVLGVAATLRHRYATAEALKAQTTQAEAEMALELSIQRSRDLERMVHVEQLATVGRMAAGVGHDLRNHLNILSLSIQLLEDSSTPAERKELVDDCTNALNGLSSILRGMGSVARLPDKRGGSCDVAATLDDCRRLTRHRWRKSNNDLIISVPDETVVAAVGATQLSQVVVNLVMNALDACESEESGRDHKVWVSASRQEQAVAIRVEDNGPGFDQDLGEKVLEAFVTTKPEDKGSGLGLSICRDIVVGVGGELQIESSPRGGASVELRIPCA